MRPHVCLLLAFAALSAQAASIPAPALTNFEKKLTDVVKKVLDEDAEQPNVSSEQELIDQANIVKDIDNKLLKQVPVDSIPVKVVVEEAKPSLKASEEKKDCDKEVAEVDDDSESNIKRVEIDLKHPGEPQHQEHDTQNPEHFENEHSAVTKIKQMIQDTQVVFNDGFKDISDGLNNWLHDHEPEVSVKESIEHLQETFMEQIHKLNTTIQGYWNPDAVEDSEKKTSIKNVETGLKVLEDNFESGVESLSNGVRVLSVLKSETRDDASSTTAPASSNPLFPLFQNFQSSILSNFGNLTNTVQNFFASQGNNTASGTPTGAQSDESASTTRPPFWQSIQSSFQNIIRPNQSQQQGAQSDTPAQGGGPFAQVIQSNPILQSVINFIQPKPPQSAQSATQKPSEPASDTASEGSNVVPASADKPAADQQQKQKPEQEAQPAQAQAGPIQQIIQRNPIVQGIAGTVQKIQHTITNPEKPREETVESEKAGYPWHGHRPGDEHNNDIYGSGVVKSAPVPEIAEVERMQEPKKEEPAKTPIKQD